MLISPIKYISIKSTQPKSQSSINFVGRDVVLINPIKSNAIKYAKSLKNFHNIDFSKLDGIQEGIEVFEGCKISQIIPNFQRLQSIALIRGCRNQCGHCYLDAKPPVVYGNFEDFKSLIDGIKELNNRLSVDLKTKNIFSTNYMVLFHDSDCSNLFLRDKNGNIHEFPELNRMQFSATGKLGVFDTAGWSIKNKTTQERMERLVEYYDNDENFNREIAMINISINPFIGINYKAIENLKNGNLKNYEKLTDIYTDNAANTVITFSPLFKKGKAGIIGMSFDKKYFKNEQFLGITAPDYEILVKKIFAKVNKLLDKDFAEKKKYSKTPEELNDIKYSINYELSNYHNKFVKNGRADRFFPDKITNHYEKYNSLTKDLQKSYIDINTVSLIDLNGKVYRVNPYCAFSTDTQFNYKNLGNYKSPITPKPYDGIIKFSED